MKFLKKFKFFFKNFNVLKKKKKKIYESSIFSDKDKRYKTRNN